MNTLVTLAGFFEPISEEGFFSYIYWWQIPVLLLMIALIIFWVQYRKRQM